MLRLLREHATSWMLRGILILVAITFISWGGYSLIREKKVTYVAKVNGSIIDLREYNEAFQGVIKSYRDTLGPAFSDKMIEELKIKEKVLDELISRILIMQEAKRLGIGARDEELRSLIESIPYFQANGQFDMRLYERFLRSNRMSPEEFERMQRENLIFSKVVNLIRLNGGKVSEEEVWENYLFENERLNLKFIKVSPDLFKDKLTANEIEIKDYYQKHQEDFKTPIFLKVQYLSFRPSDFEGKIKISPDEVRRFYDLRKEAFKIPKQVRAREILIKVDPQDSMERIEEKRKRAEEILEKARKVKDFSSLAKQYSESATASDGGDLGWLQKGTVDELVENGLFSTKKGELSGIVKGRLGFYLFKIEDVREERERSFDEVKDQIYQALKKEKAKNEASRMADDAFYSLFRSRELETYAGEKGIPIKITGFFKDGDEIPEIGKSQIFYSHASSLKTGEISPVVSIPPNFYILKLVDKRESRIPPIEDVKKEIYRKIIDLKAEEKARQVADEMLEKLRSGKSIEDVAREKGYKLEETGFFTRQGGVIPKIGPITDLLSLISSLTEENRIPKEVLKTKEGFFVVKLQALEEVDRTKFQSIKKTYERRLIYQKQEDFFENWLLQLRSKAKIEINKELL